MKIASFLKLVEIQTKVASVIPFLIGTLYAVYRFSAFNLKNFLLMLVSLLCIDMATTAINNFMDYKKATKRHGFGYEHHNAIVAYGLQISTVTATIFILLGIAIIMGFLLFINTDIIVLLLGAASFAIGILYSFGPLPISRTPFGEIFSGSFMGFGIPFLAAYIHIHDKGFLALALQSGILTMKLNLPEILYILLISAPAAAGIANIMLANNICDIEDDLANKRFTLPVYIGKPYALLVFRFLYYAGYLALIVLFAISRMSPLILLPLLTIIPVERHIRLFYQEQSKQKTFVLAVKNFVLVNVALLVTLVLAIL